MAAPEIDILRKRLAPIWVIDEQFFERRPERWHRIRRAYSAEIQMAQRMGIITQPLPDGLRVFLGVRPEGSPRKVIGFLPPDTETDLDEEDAAKVYAQLETHSDETLIKFAAQYCAAPSSSQSGGSNA